MDDEDHIRQVYDDNYFFGGGVGYDNYLDNRNILEQAGRRYAVIVDPFLGRQPAVLERNLLDVGAAAGFLMKGFQTGGWTCTGVEPNERLAEIARSQLNLHMIGGSWEEVDVPHRYHLIVMIQVISHFAQPIAALRKAHRHLESGGLLLVETWNRDSWTAKLFRRQWHQYNPPSVLHWFSKQSLRQLLESIGFEPVANGRAPKKIKAGQAASFLRHATGGQIVGRILGFPLAVIPKRTVIPYFGDDVYWSIFRKIESGS